MRFQPALPDDAEERARVKRVVAAADALFKKHGFRGVTMEQVAREAAVAKATLYSYFKNKDELYTAVSTRMAVLLVREIAAALDARGRIEDRVAEAIVTRRRRAFELYRASPHAEELYTAKARLAGAIFAEAEEDMLARFTAALQGVAKLQPEAERLARALYLGSAEIAARSQSLEALETELRAFVATHLAGARALARRH